VLEIIAYADKCADLIRILVIARWHYLSRQSNRHNRQFLLKTQMNPPKKYPKICHDFEYL